MAKERAKIGVALGGGGLRGLAHVGVLEVMEQAKIPIDALTGTSMGGIIAGLYAAGVPMATIKRASSETHILDFATPDPSRHGLIGHTKMQQFFANLLGSESITFADLKIPTAMIAADLETKRVVVLNEGPLIPAMMATSAFPIVFSPVRRDGHWLVDGGVLNNLPFDIIRQMKVHRVIGVNTPPSMHNLLSVPAEKEKRPRLSPQTILALITKPQDWKIPMLVAENSIAATAAIINQERMQECPPDLLLSISVPNTGTFIADDNTSIINLGYQTAMEAIDKLIALRDTPLPSPWQRQWQILVQRLKRAWHAYNAPVYPTFPHTP